MMGHLSQVITVLYLGPEEKCVRRVGIIMKNKLAASLSGYWPVSDRVIAAQFNTRPSEIYVVQVYAPTFTADQDDTDQFYHDLDKALEMSKSREIKIVMGDLNAKVEKETEGLSVGPYGKEERNETGDQFVNWCEVKDLIIKNTWFKNHERRLVNWNNPGNRTRNQIGFLCVNRCMRKELKRSRAHPRNDCDSHHARVIAEIYMRRLKNQRETSRI